MEERKDFDSIQSLRNHGLQVTYQRLAIYQTLCDTKDHLSAENICQQVRTRFPMISLGTVYKTLERFHEVGLIQKFGPALEVARYEATRPLHHHLFCVKCQAVHDIDVHGEAAPVLPDDKGFQIIERQVIYRGYCPACRKS